MVYQFQLNLQQRAAFSFAIALWEKEEVIAMMKKFFEFGGFNRKTNSIFDWQQLINVVINLWDKSVLPPKLAEEVENILEALGRKIYRWYQYLGKGDQLHLRTDKEVLDLILPIYWTPHGTIDEIEIFKSSWLKKKTIKPSALYNTACKLALEQYIEALWQIVPINIQKNYSQILYLENYYDQHLLAYWKYCRDGKLEELNDYFSFVMRKSQRNGQLKSSPPFVPSYSVDENMLRTSIYLKNSVAMTYFWNKLSEEKKNENIVDCARTAVRYYVAYCERNPIDGYEIEKYIEMCLFLVNQMTTSQKKLFFNTSSVSSSSLFCVPFARSGMKSAFLAMLASSWPWQEFFIPFLNDIQEYLELDSQAVFEILSSITWTMEMRHDQKKLKIYGHVEQNNSKYQSLLQAAWGSIPGSSKQKVEDTMLDVMLRNLLKIWDLDSIKMIFNDRDIAPVRMQYLECGKEIFKEWIINGEYKLFDQFMQEIMISDDEKKFIKDSMDHIELGNYFIRRRCFDLLAKFLNWKCQEIDKEKK
ncbi:uncharacterized protein [Chelonus insularis]|uniref:uncharacterized protein n=1 Tax=Chelonus insularis TaxID=460826 RepID=UPI00158A855D|nr:uncharacterized protein LOC118071511 [Chelonus insularis]